MKSDEQRRTSSNEDKTIREQAKRLRVGIGQAKGCKGKKQGKIRQVALALIKEDSRRLGDHV